MIYFTVFTVLGSGGGLGGGGVWQVIIDIYYITMFH